MCIMEYYVSEQHEKRRRMFPHYNFGSNSEYYIFVCEHCKNEKRVRKMSYTSTKSIYWSDGKIEACNDWPISYMQRCPHCGKYYYVSIEEAQTGFGIDIEDDGRLEIGEYAALCSDKKMMESLPIENMASLLMQYVQQYNDTYRRGAQAEENEEKATYEQSKMFTDAILFLTERCRIPEILIADLYRQAGMFRKCMEYAADIVNRIKGEDLETLDRTRMLAIQGNTEPFITKKENFI